MAQVLLVTDVSFTNYNVQFSGDPFTPDNTRLTMYDGSTTYTRTVTTTEANNLMNNGTLLVSFSNFGLTSFKLRTQYELTLINTDGVDIIIALGNVLLQSNISLPTDVTTSTANVILTDCSGCTALYYGKTSDLVGTKQTINIPTIADNGSYPVSIGFSVLLDPVLNYTLWTDTQGGNTLAADGSVNVPLVVSPPLVVSSISEATIHINSTGVDARFINCNGLGTSYKVYIGEDDGFGTASNKTAWGPPISTIDTADFARLLLWSEFSGFTFALGKVYILWIDDTGGDTFGAPGSTAIARIIPAKFEPSTIYYVQLTDGTNIFKGQITVNNATNTIDSFADVTTPLINLLRSGGANNLPGDFAASNTFKQDTNRLFLVKQIIIQKLR